MALNNSSIKTVIVTGGAGYIGSILVRKLLLENYRVICVDKLMFGAASLLDVWDHPNFVFKRSDITKFGEVDQIINDEKSKIHAIIHLAAIVGDPACKLEPELTRKTNLDAPIHLLEKGIQSGIERFIFASTCSNYGKMAEPGGYLDETSPLAPISLYAELKVEFEKVILHKTERKESFCPTCLRFATVYGLSPRMRFDLTVNEFTKQLALGKELVIFGEQFWRPYCHVSDFSRAILAVLKAPKDKVAYEVFNVGDTRENYTKKMLAEELLKQIPEGIVKYVKRDEDPRDYRVSFDKIQKEIGFTITKTVPDGIRDIISSLNLRVIEDPENQRYYNIPN